MNKQLNISKEFLMQLYIQNMKPASYIAKRLTCAVSTIYSYMIKYNISRRIQEECHFSLNEILTKKFLKKEYIKNKKPMFQIAKELKCSYGVIYKRLIKYNIKIRTITEARLLRIGCIITKKFLLKEYVKNLKSSVDIANELDCSSTTIQKYLKIYNIPRRNPSEAQLDKQTGKIMLCLASIILKKLYKKYLKIEKILLQINLKNY